MTLLHPKRHFDGTLINVFTKSRSWMICAPSEVTLSPALGCSWRRWEMSHKQMTGVGSKYKWSTSLVHKCQWFQFAHVEGQQHQQRQTEVAVSTPVVFAQTQLSTALSHNQTPSSTKTCFLNAVSALSWNLKSPRKNVSYQKKTSLWKSHIFACGPVGQIQSIFTPLLLRETSALGISMATHCSQHQ